MPGYSVNYFHKSSERKISVVIKLLVQLFDGLIDLFNTFFKGNYLNLLPCVRFIRLEGAKMMCRE